MESPDRERCFAAVLPWLCLEREATVGPFRFTPMSAANVPSVLASVDATARQTLLDVMGVYRDLAGRPVGLWALVTLDGHAPLESLPEDVLGDLYLARDILCFACLACNEYSSDSEQYTNARRFEVHRAAFVAGDTYHAFESPRRGRAGWSDCRPIGDTAVTTPFECTPAGRATWDDAFLEVLWSVCHPQSDENANLRIAINCYSETHRDDPWASLERQVVVAGSALEYLTGTKGQQSMANRALEYLAAYDGPGLRRGAPPRVTPDCFIACKIDHANKTDTIPQDSRWVYYWLRELHCRRSGIVHPSEPKTCAWSDSEHLTLFAYTFPLIVKCRLLHEGAYELTPSDRVRLDALDALIELGDPADPEERRNSPEWRRAIQAARHNCGQPRLAELLGLCPPLVC